MSLQVWLPMTKDLRSQGLSDVTVTNNGATFNSAGKLGGCYYFNGSSKMFLPSFSTTRSIAFWLKCPKTNTTIAFVDYQSKLGFGFQSNGYIIPNCGSSSDARKMYSPENFIANEWNHIVLIRDDNFTDVVLYINGELQTNRSGNNQWDNSVDGCFIGGRSQGTHMTCSINDFRVYDHALSPMEVKQISQGLVLHYLLDNNGFGNENIIPNSVEMALGASSAVIGRWREAGSNSMTKSRVAIDDSPIGSCYCFQNAGIQTPNDGSCYGIDSFVFEANTQYTISMWARIISGTEGYAGFAIQSVTFGNGSHSKFEKNYYVTTLPSDGKWIRCWINFTTNSSTNRNIYIGITTGDTNATTQMCGVKIEKGDKVTPWCPNSSDELATVMGMNDGIEYDCSGFGNNGIQNNLPIYSSDTAKYNASIHFDGVNQTVQLPNLTTLIPDSIFTFNIWFKRLESEPSSKPWETILGGPSGFELESCSANNVHDAKIKAYSWGGGNFAFEFDKWNMLTMVSNGTNALFYLNGELKLTGTYKALVSGNYFLGSWRDTSTQNYKGYMSDARIYVTALSASDIQSLYQNSAYIDSSGNVYGAVHEEV